MSLSLSRLISALDAELRVKDFNDDSKNGLQVENARGRVSTVALGVDASLEFFRRAKEIGADLCVVHHGISWGESLSRITGENHKIVSFLIENGIALYAAHLPLDAHPRLGNNAGIARALGLAKIKSFCEYHGQQIGFKGEFAKAIPLAELQAKIRRVVCDGIEPTRFAVLPFGKKTVKTLGVVSGGAASEVREAIADGLDCYLTGEANLQSYNAAKSAGINMIAAGHYATERFGVKAVGGFLKKRFEIPCEFIDFGITY